LGYGPIKILAQLSFRARSGQLKQGLVQGLILGQPSGALRAAGQMLGQFLVFGLTQVAIDGQ
jgi:hypothetical protein